MKRRGPYYVYIVRCSDGTYYTGSAKDIQKRIESHRMGNGAKYLRGRIPLTLVYVKRYASLSRALKAENFIKSLNRSRKEEIIKRYQSKQGRGSKICNT